MQTHSGVLTVTRRLTDHHADSFRCAHCDSKVTPRTMPIDDLWSPCPCLLTLLPLNLIQIFAKSPHLTLISLSNNQDY